MNKQIESMKAFGFVSILQVAKRDPHPDNDPNYETLYIAKHGTTWRFIIDCDTSRHCSGQVGTQYKRKLDIKFAAYEYAKETWNFKDSEMSAWVIEYKEKHDDILREAKQG